MCDVHNLNKLLLEEVPGAVFKSLGPFLVATTMELKWGKVAEAAQAEYRDNARVTQENLAIR